MTATAFARTTDPETSHAAALSLGGDNIRQSQREILDALTELGPMTDRTILALFTVGGRPLRSPSGLRTRRSELVDKGLVVDSGRRNTAPSGRQEVVWAAAS